MTQLLRLATWNVNSIRSRLDRVLDFLRRTDVDVLAMQETKVADAGFPAAAFERAGYRCLTNGINHWNGVALLSRVGIDDPRTGFAGMPQFGEPPATEARAISAVCGGVRVYSLYVPNGRELGHPHYEYKLDFMAALRDHILAELTTGPELELVLCGDFNIAPTDADVWSPAFYEGKTHTSLPEREAFAGLLEAGLTDLVRPFTDQPRTFTYWDYQQLRFAKNRGMRIDFALGSAAVARRVVGAAIDRDERKGIGASDHAPVVIELGQKGVQR